MGISSIHNGGFLSANQIRNAQKREEEKPQIKNNKTSRNFFDLPSTYTITNVKGIKPNDLFDIQYHFATTLSDGSKLVRPICLSLGRVDITPKTDGKRTYVVDFIDMGVKKEMSEIELLSNKALTRGTIKQTGEDGIYRFRLIDKNGDIQKFSMNKQDALEYLHNNLLYM